MSGLKRLSGKTVIKILISFGFTVASQKGNHIKLQRKMIGGDKQTLTIPNHKEIDPGTLLAIFRQASRYLPPEDLRNKFYNQ